MRKQEIWHRGHSAQATDAIALLRGRTQCAPRQIADRQCVDNSKISRTSVMTTIIECHPPATGSPAPDLKAVKAKQQTAWSSGDYAVIGTTLQIVGEQLAEAMDLRAGQTVLDVAAGNGNATLAAPGAGARSRPPTMSNRCW